MSGAPAVVTEPGGLGGTAAARRLQKFLESRFPAVRGAVTIERTQGGLSNPTFFLSTPGWSVVLRKQPGTTLLKSAHAIDREFRVMSALQGSAVPVPKPLLYYPQTDILDTPFYLMERLKGRIFDDYAMPGLSPDERRQAFHAMAKIMAEIHRFDWNSAGLADYGRAGNYFNRQFERWSKQWDSFSGFDNPWLDELIKWLSTRIPENETISLCHGDFRVANIMFHPTEPKIIGVLDWELSTLGHPLADVGFNAQAWVMAPDENGGIAGLELAALGIPPENEYLENYYRNCGRPEKLTVFHKAFAMFRAAVGTAGVAVRGKNGNAADVENAAIGSRLSRVYARRAMQLIERH